MSVMNTFVANLTAHGIDPEAWKAAREAGSDFPDYHLARDIEELMIAATFDRAIELERGETLLDVFSLLWTAMSRWPLAEETDVR